MKPLATEWATKAEGDWATAQRELKARKSPNYDAACFHAQQCAEKYFKARRQEADVPFGRTHNLESLLNLVLPLEPSWTVLRPLCRSLTAFAVEFRYPGEFSDKMLARHAVTECQEIRIRVRKSLGLET